MINILRIIISLLLFSSTNLFSITFPQPEGYINDFANIMDAGTKSELTGLISDCEKKISIEIAVVTVKSLENLAVEDYANQLFNKWGIGKKNKNNGLLVLVAPNERKIRIEVGYGMEPVINDGLAGEIIRTEFVPEFKNGDYNKGIFKGVSRIIRILTKEEPAPMDNQQFANRNKTVFEKLFLSIFVVIGFFIAGIAIKNKIGGLLTWGLGFGGVPLLMSGIFNILAIAAIIFFILGLNTGGKFGGTGRKGSHYSGWIWGSGSGGFGGGGGFGGFGGGGGFSGGSSGGGGAGGSW